MTKDPEIRSDKARRKAEAAARLMTLEARLERIEGALLRRAEAAPRLPSPAGAPSGDALAGTSWETAAPRLAALGHPVRLNLLKAVLEGPADVALLLGQSGAGSSGQLYHHLKELTAQGWLQPEGRGRYALPPARRAALMAVISAALAP